MTDAERNEASEREPQPWTFVLIGDKPELAHTPSSMGFLTQILGRPEYERPYVVIPVGYQDADATVLGITRKSRGEVLIEIPPHSVYAACNRSSEALRP